MYERIEKSVICPYSVVIIERQFIFAGNIFINEFLIFEVHDNMIIDILNHFENHQNYCNIEKDDCDPYQRWVGELV